MIAELFERDPLKLTRKDLDKIIAYMRANRENFIKKPKVKKATKAVDVEVNL